MCTWGILFAPQAMISADDADWVQWRGPNRDGFVAASQWPSSLTDTSLVQKWKVALGESYSGPLVVGDRVFVTETVDNKIERVRALERSTGKELWQVEWEGSMQVPFFAKKNGDWIRATPAYSDGKLYVAGIRDVLVCLDAASGNVDWKIDFVAEFKSELPTFGFVCSPMIDGQHLYVQAGGCFVKLEKATGKVVWQGLKDGGGMNGSAFSSPVVATLAGVRQILVQTRTTLAGVDIATGEQLWSFEVPAFRGMNILTPTVFGDAVFTSSYGGKSLLLDVAHDASGWTVKERWNHKAEGYMSTPVIVGNHVYMHLRNRRFTCIDLKTGEATWTSIPFGEYWSLVANSDRILALDQRGELLLIRANPEKFELIERRKLTEDSTWAHLAVAGSQVAIRELKAISFYDWK
ncbi:MAG: PQQ-like beta-propeller repeat protein [Pirellulaceae bacterium]|nr:PQQ-like beta-propeller repeat protein [Pirellulaceae bacterium]